MQKTGNLPSIVINIWSADVTPLGLSKKSGYVKNGQNLPDLDSVSQKLTVVFCIPFGYDHYSY